MKHVVRFLSIFALLVFSMLVGGTSGARAQDCFAVVSSSIDTIGDNTGTVNCTTAGLTLTGNFVFDDINETGVFTGTISGDQNGPVNLTYDLSADDRIVFSGNVLGTAVNCTVTASGSITGTCGGLATLFSGAAGNGISNNKVAASGRTQEIVSQQVLTSPLQTSEELEQQNQAAAAGGGATAPRVRMFLADAKVEVNSFRGAKSTIGGVTIGSTIEFNNKWTVGAMVPLDYMSLPVGNAVRFGMVGFGQYNWHPSENKAWSIKPTVFANYLYTAGSGGAAKYGTYGGGAGVSITHDNGGKFIPSLVTLISYNEDDTGGGNNYQTLIAIGPRVGFRPSNRWVLDVGVLYNKDISSYLPAGVKDDYFDLTLGAAYRISSTFKLDFGYRKTLGIPGFRSDEFTIGGRFQL